MPNQDGKVVISISSDAANTARDFQKLDEVTKNYEKSLETLKSRGLTETQKSIKEMRTQMVALAQAGGQNSASFKALAQEVRIAENTLKSAKKAVNEAVSGQSGLNNKISQTINEQKSLCSGNGVLSDSFSNLAGMVKLAAVSFVALKLRDYAQQAINTAAQFEQLGTSFEVMAGSTQAGKALTNQLIELANKTPMTTASLAKNAKTLLSFGESAQNVIADLKLLGDITGGETERMNALSLAFAQVGATGRLTGQDLLQMVNAGFNPLQIMSEKSGKSMAELKKEMGEGRVSFQMVKQAMIDATSEGGRYFGMMEKQASTLNGLMSTNADTWQQVSKNIGDFFMPAAKAAIKILNELGKAILRVQEKLHKIGQDVAFNTVDSKSQAVQGFTKQAERLNKVAAEYASRGNTQRAEEYKRKAQEYIDAAKRMQAETDALSAKQKASSKKSSVPLGFDAFSSDTSNGKFSSKAKKNKDKVISSYEWLQKSASEAEKALQSLAAKGVTSGQVWDSQVQKLGHYNEELQRVKLATSEPFKRLNTELQMAQDKLNNLAASKIINIDEIKTARKEVVTLKNKLAEVQQLTQTSPYQAKQSEVGILTAKLQDMAIGGQVGSAGFNELKNQLRLVQNEILKADTAISNSIGLTWSSISSTISSQLSTALTTPLQQGESAFQRFGNVALNVIQQIAQAWLANSLNNMFTSGKGKSSLGSLGSVIGGALGSVFGGVGTAVGGFLGGAVGNTIKNANGNAYINGNIIPFAKGGVVRQDTYFPMANGNTGLMGEKSAEAIMPLKRTSNGSLGVEATGKMGSNVYIYNNSQSDIETIQRPDGDTEVFIRKVNNALGNERTNNGFTRALQRQQSKGSQVS